MLNAKVLKDELRYSEGSFHLTQGVKRGASDGETSQGYFQNRGYGWGSYAESSTLALPVLVDGKKYELWIDYFWKARVGTLVNHIRQLIAETAPEEIEVEKKTGRKGTVYFKATSAAMDSWLKRFWEKALADADAKRVNQLAKRFLRRKKNYEPEAHDFVQNLLNKSLQSQRQGKDLDVIGFMMEDEDVRRQEDQFWKKQYGPRRR